MRAGTPGKRPSFARRTIAGLLAGACLAALLCGGSALAAEPVGFLYAGGSGGVEAMAVGPEGQLTPVSGALHGPTGAIAMATVHAANGVNVYELAPLGSLFGPYGITHFTVDPKTGELTQAGPPFGSFKAYSYPGDLYGFDGYGRFGGKSELLLGACTNTETCAGKVFEVAVSPVDGSLSEDGAVLGEEASVIATAGSADEYAVLAVEHGQAYLHGGTIDHESGHVAFGEGEPLTIAGVSPEAPCCIGMTLALREHLLVAGGAEIGKPIKEKEFLAEYGVGYYERGAKVTPRGVTPVNPFRAISVSPIAFAGNLVVVGIVDPPEPHGAALQVLDTGGSSLGEVKVNEVGGAVTSLLSLGDTLYVGDEFGPIEQLGGVGAESLRFLEPASPSGGPDAVGGMTGFLTSELVTPPGGAGKGGGETPKGQGPGGGVPVGAAAAGLLRLALSPGSFKAAAAGGSVMNGKPPAGKPRGSKVGFQLSAPATVRFTAIALLPGKRVKKGGKTSCAKATGAVPAKLRCTRKAPLSGSFTVAGGAGTTSFRFSGRLAGKRLAPGRYELVAAPLVAGKAGAARRAPFTILG